MLKYFHTFTFSLVVVLSMGQVELVDQTAGQSGASIVAQDYEAAYEVYTSFAAEDLIVPIGEQWHLDSVLLFGEYVTPLGNPVAGSGIVISICNDAGGSPGAVIYTDTLASGSDFDQDGSLFHGWSSSLILNPGTYWLVGASRKDFGTNLTQWQWFSSTTTEGDTAMWINPGNGFTLNNCPNWNEVTTCYGSNLPGLSFILFGCPVPKPQVSNLPTDTSFCSNEVLQLNVSSNSSNAVFDWSDGAQGNAWSTQMSGTYSLTVTDTVTGCAIIDSVIVIADEAPIVSIDDASFCEGDSLELDAGLCSTCTPLWSTGETSAQISITNPGWYTLSIIDTSTGCGAIDSAEMTWLEIDPIEFSPGPPFGVCEGSTQVFSIQDTFQLYEWSTGSVTNESEVGQAGALSVTVTAANGCQTSDSILIVNFPPPEPEIEMTFISGVFILEVTQSFESYWWSNGGATSSSITADWPYYLLVVEDSNGCEGTATIQVPLEVSELDAIRPLIFPNPTTEELFIIADNVSSIELRNALGQLVIRQTGDQQTESIDIRSIKVGVYYLAVHCQGHTFTQTIIKH